MGPSCNVAISKTALSIQIGTYPNAVHEQPDKVEDDSECPRHELGRQARQKHRQRYEYARAPKTRAQTVLGNPDVRPSPLSPLNDHSIGHTAGERCTNCDDIPFISLRRI